MKSKLGAAFAEAIATVKTELWDDDSQPSPAQIAAATATATAAPAPRWEGDRWNNEIENLHSKLSHVKEGLETALARVSYLEQSIHDKENSLEVEPDDRLVDENTLERGKGRDRVLAERAKELWGEEENEGRVIKAVRIKVKAKEGAEDEKETEEAGGGEESHYVEDEPDERNSREPGNAQQQVCPRKTRRGSRAGAAVKRRTNANSARDGRGDRGRGGGAVVGDDAGENPRQAGPMCDRVGPASLRDLLKKFYPLILSWVCISLFVWRLAQPQGGPFSGIE